MAYVSRSSSGDFLEGPARFGKIWGLGGGEFSDFSDFPQMENRDLGWTGIGLGSPKTLFSAKKPWFLGNFWPYPIIWGFPLGPPVGPYWLLLAHAQRVVGQCCRLRALDGKGQMHVQGSRMQRSHL